jgi:hypothetical protein
MALKDDKVIAKLPADEKEALIDFADRLDVSQGQIIREALQRFRPVLEQRVAERERATGLAEVAA